MCSGSLLGHESQCRGLCRTQAVCGQHLAAGYAPRNTPGPAAAHPFADSVPGVLPNRPATGRRHSCAWKGAQGHAPQSRPRRNAANSRGFCVVSIRPRTTRTAGIPLPTNPKSNEVLRSCFWPQTRAPGHHAHSRGHPLPARASMGPAEVRPRSISLGAGRSPATGKPDHHDGCARAPGTRRAGRQKLGGAPSGEGDMADTFRVAGLERHRPRLTTGSRQRSDGQAGVGPPAASCRLHAEETPPEGCALHPFWEELPTK